MLTSLAIPLDGLGKAGKEIRTDLRERRQQENETYNLSAYRTRGEAQCLARTRP